MNKRDASIPFLWSGLFLAGSTALAFLATHQEKHGIEQGSIPPIPTISAGQSAFPLAYFFLLVAVVGIVLFLIPLSKLKFILRLVFAFAFSWGTFILFWLMLQHGPPSALSWPTVVSGLLALSIGILWLFFPKVWFHDALLLLTLVAMASTFGSIFSPSTAIIVMGLVAVYDLLAVRFGYMQWMAQKLSESDTLPALFIPHKSGYWNASIRGPDLKRLFDRNAPKEYSVLGGGDIGFPVLVAVSISFHTSFQAGLIMGGFSLAGLAAAYAFHVFVFKGKPTPALPPLFLLCLIGFLITRLLF